MFLMVESQSLTFRRENRNTDDVSSLSPLEGGQTVTASEQCPRVGWGTVQLGDAHLNSVLALEGVLAPEPHWGLQATTPRGRCLVLWSCIWLLLFLISTVMFPKVKAIK